MSVYTYTSARQNLARILDEASNEADVFIKRKNGQLFKIVHIEDDKSGLDVPGVDTDISTQEIVQMIRASREDRN